jgi:hypothetical protein
MKSRTVWTIVAIFIYNGLQGIAPEIRDAVPLIYQPGVAIGINAILGSLAAYFRLKPKQKYN